MNTKNLLTYILMTAGIIIMFSLVVLNQLIIMGKIDTPDLFIEEIEKLVEKPVIVEKIIEVEKKIDTWRFVVHLNPRIDESIAREIGKAVEKYSDKYELPEKLILSIINKESTLNPLARSKVAFGLMQVYPKFHKEKLEKRGITDNKELYHIDKNIDVGCEIFREYYDKSKGCFKKTFHRYLSKKATIQQRNYYMNTVFETWVELDLFEYQKKG